MLNNNGEIDGVGSFGDGRMANTADDVGNKDIGRALMT
jgi:hypothetical protein